MKMQDMKMRHNTAGFENAGKSLHGKQLKQLRTQQKMVI